MKRIFPLLITLILLLGMLSGLTVTAAGSVTVTANKTTVTVGNTVTVTVKCDGGGKGIGAMDAYFHYNAKVFEYQSCTGAAANGGAGNLKLSYFAEELEGPKSLTVTLTLKAIAVGSGDFKWETEGMYDDDDKLLSNAVKTLSVSANNPTLSGDATLSYLHPSKGTLTPKFDKNVTEYTVSVPYTVTRLLLNYTTTDPGATTAITNNADLAVGKTVRVITVTAPNGTTKKYSVTVTREAQQSTSDPSASDGSTSTTQPQLPTEDALEVNVDGMDMLIADTRPSAALPENYEWSSVEINGIEIPAAKQPTAGLTLLYLIRKEDSKTGAFYLYNEAEDTFLPFHQLKGVGGTYTVHNLPDTETGPVGTVTGTFTVGEKTVTAYVYENPELADYTILYLTSPDGDTGLYTHDRLDGSLQRYHETGGAAKDEVLVVTPEPMVESNAFVAFVTQYKVVILTVSVACCGLAVLIAAVVLAIRLAPKGNQKH